MILCESACIEVPCAKVVQKTDTTFFPMQMTVGAQYLQLCFLGGRHPGEAMPSPSPSASRRACFRCSACGLILPTKQAASDHLVTDTRKPLPSQNSVPPPPAVMQHVSRRLPELSSSSSSSPSSFFWEQGLSMEDERQPLSVLGGWLALLWKLLIFLEPCAWESLQAAGTLYFTL